MKLLAAAAAAVTTLGISAAAHADVIYSSTLDTINTKTGTTTGTFGVVTIDQVDADDLKITVHLDSPQDYFVYTSNGNAHWPFVYNLDVATPSDVSWAITQSSTQTFAGAALGSYSETPYGDFNAGVTCCGNKNGSSHDTPTDLVFTITDTAGITFAGIGATLDPTTNQVLTLGTGDHLVSNSGGWWFAADVSDGANNTNQIAASVATCINGCSITQTTVPEPATWALMIFGFGGAGALLRHRRRVAVA